MPKKKRITVNHDLFNRVFTVALSLGTTIKQLKPEKEEAVPKKKNITVNRDLFNRVFTVALSFGMTIK